VRLEPGHFEQKDLGRKNHAGKNVQRQSDDADDLRCLVAHLSPAAGRLLLVEPHPHRDK
jgi:hypothetical protein